MRYKTLSEVCKILDLKPWKIWYMECAGKISPIPRLGNRRVFDEEAIQQIKKVVQDVKGGKHHE